MSLKGDVIHGVASGADNFSVMLLRLYAKADPINRAKIKRGWPNLVEVREAWFNAPYIDDRLVESAIPDLPYDGPMT